MKLLGVIAAIGLAVAPLSAIADEAKIAVPNSSLAAAAPAPGGVAKSSFDFGGPNADLLVVGLVAGTGLIVAGTIFAIASGDDDDTTVVTTTGTN